LRKLFGKRKEGKKAHGAGLTEEEEREALDRDRVGVLLVGMGLGMGWRRRRMMGLLGSGFVGLEFFSRVWWGLWGGWGSWSCSLYVFCSSFIPSLCTPK